MADHNNVLCLFFKAALVAPERWHRPGFVAQGACVGVQAAVKWAEEQAVVAGAWKGLS